MAGKKRGFLVALVLLAIIAAVLLLPVNRWLIALVAWMRQAGALGVAIYVLTFVVCAISLAPGSILSAAAGFLYGPFWGVILASPAACLGATLTFLLGRYVLRERVQQLVTRFPSFSAIDQAVGEQGFKIVVLIRMSPLLPFSLLNYVLSASSISVRRFALGTFVGMIPGTCLYVYLGSLVSNAGELLNGQKSGGMDWKQGLYWVGLAVTVIASIVITRIARQALRRDVKLPQAIEESQHTRPERL